MYINGRSDLVPIIVATLFHMYINVPDIYIYTLGKGIITISKAYKNSKKLCLLFGAWNI